METTMAITAAEIAKYSEIFLDEWQTLADADKREWIDEYEADVRYTANIQQSYERAMHDKEYRDNRKLAYWYTQVTNGDPLFAGWTMPDVKRDDASRYCYNLQYVPYSGGVVRLISVHILHNGEEQDVMCRIYHDGKHDCPENEYPQAIRALLDEVDSKYPELTLQMERELADALPEYADIYFSQNETVEDGLDFSTPIVEVVA